MQYLSENFYFLLFDQSVNFVVQFKNDADHKNYNKIGKIKK